MPPPRNMNSFLMRYIDYWSLFLPSTKSLFYYSSSCSSSSRILSKLSPTLISIGISIFTAIVVFHLLSGGVGTLSLVMSTVK